MRRASWSGATTRPCSTYRARNLHVGVGFLAATSGDREPGRLEAKDAPDRRARLETTRPIGGCSTRGVRQSPDSGAAPRIYRRGMTESGYISAGESEPGGPPAAFQAEGGEHAAPAPAFAPVDGHDVAVGYQAEDGERAGA